MGFPFVRTYKKLRFRLFNQTEDRDAVQMLQAANDNRGELAVLVIDVQQEFCDPSHSERRGNRRTVKISDRIASMMPAFRAAGIPVYAIYFDSSKRLRVRDVDWYKFRPEPGDICVAKDEDSAFEGSDIKKILERNGHRTLLACGFNRSACVGKTIVDAAIEGFNVLLLSDLVGNDNNNPHDKGWAKQDMKWFKRYGVTSVRSAEALALLTPRKNAANMAAALLP